VRYTTGWSFLLEVTTREMILVLIGIISQSMLERHSFKIRENCTVFPWIWNNLLSYGWKGVSPWGLFTEKT